MRKPWLLAPVILILAACAYDYEADSGINTPSALPPQTSVEQYECENGTDVFFTAVMVDDLLKGSIKVDGVETPMHQIASGSGVLLAADDQDDTTQWHIKGDDAVLSYQDDDKEVNIACTKQ